MPGRSDAWVAPIVPVLRCLTIKSSSWVDDMSISFTSEGYGSRGIPVKNFMVGDGWRTIVYRVNDRCIYIYTYLYILYLHVMWVRLKVCGPKILWFLFETTHFIAKATLQISNQQTRKQKQIKRTKHWKTKIWGAPVSFSLSYSLYDSKFPNINHHVMRLNDEYRKDTYIDKAPQWRTAGYIDSAFVLMFLLELLIRVMLERLQFFRDCANWFDALANCGSCQSRREADAGIKGNLRQAHFLEHHGCRMAVGEWCKPSNATIVWLKKLHFSWLCMWSSAIISPLW